MGVDDFSFFDCSSSCYFLLIELHYNFSLSYIVLTCLLLLLCPQGAVNGLLV